MKYSGKLDGRLSRELAELAEFAGTESFYPRAANILGKYLNNSRTLVTRYSKYDQPKILVNNAVTEEIRKMYNDGLYRMDALYRFCRTSPKAGVVDVMSLGEGYLSSEWVTGLLRMASVSDEIAILLPAPGDITIVLSCVRHKSNFLNTDILNAEKLLPLLVAFHNLHVERIYTGILAGTSHMGIVENIHGAAVFNTNGDCVYSNEDWKQSVEKSKKFRLVHKAILSKHKGSQWLGKRGVVHWEDFQTNVPSLTLYRIAFFEYRTPEPTCVSSEEMLNLFKKIHKLTPREIDVVREVISGYSNKQIASHLGISTGTVKNCRWRLYYKLDITTERELFCMFLAMVLEHRAIKSQSESMAVDGI